MYCILYCKFRCGMGINQTRNSIPWRDWKFLQDWLVSVILFLSMTIKNIHRFAKVLILLSLSPQGFYTIKFDNDLLQHVENISERLILQPVLVVILFVHECVCCAVWAKKATLVKINILLPMATSDMLNKAEERETSFQEKDW